MMLPWVHGFQWEAGHLIFLGLFFTVALGIGTTVVSAVVRTRRDCLREGADGALWRAEFAALASTARLCRAAFADERHTSLCVNGFNCSACTRYPLLPAAAEAETNVVDGEFTVNGLRYPLDRAYHRGHTWVFQEADGTVGVGLDEMASRLLGPPDWTDLPPVGTLLQLNGNGWRLRKHGSVFRILSPISGKVVGHGSAESGGFLRVRPESPAVAQQHLLRGRNEVQGWVLREMERLQAACADGSVGISLADGGELVEDLSVVLRHGEWDGLCGEMLLDI
jgi:hypothetical protein